VIEVRRRNQIPTNAAPVSASVPGSGTGIVDVKMPEVPSVKVSP
jgi:hypothetical protein